jgi:hypothetical protein
METEEERRRRVRMTASAASAYAAGFLSLPLFWPGGARAPPSVAASTATAAGSSIRSGSPLAIHERRASSVACLPDRGALLIAHGLPGGDATVRARPVRPSRRRCTRVTCRRAREVRDGTVLGTIAHGDRSSGVRAPASAANSDCTARFGVLPQMPVKLRSLPSGDAHEFANIGPSFRRCAERHP